MAVMTKSMELFRMRKRLALAATLALLLPTTPTLAAEPQMPRLATPGLEPAFSAEVLVGAPLDVGAVDGAKRRIVPIVGGKVSGPKISAEVLSGGADWQVIRDDGTTAVYARYTLRTTDGQVISVANTGVRRGPPDVLRRLAAGERVNPAAYYFRSTPVFDVADGRFAWLRENVFVCTGAREANRVLLDCFTVE
jgi:Protein of unknown function (DUF3237)